MSSTSHISIIENMAEKSVSNGYIKKSDNLRVENANFKEWICRQSATYPFRVSASILSEPVYKYLRICFLNIPG